MSEIQKITGILAADLPGKTGELYNSGFRLVQISCTRLEGEWELTYSFDKDFELVNLRFILTSEGSVIPSISNIYWAAFLYENEIADLFGMKFQDMAVDYKGSFYRTRLKHPFSQLPENKPEVK
jgi:ech hydrogenase subunit D